MNTTTTQHTLVDALRDLARQAEHLSIRLSSKLRPGHIDYISKEDAASALIVFAEQARAALKQAEGE